MSWKQYEFGELVKLSNEKYYPEKSDKDYSCIELEHLDQVSGRLLGFVNSKEQKSTKNFFRTGQVLYGKLRPYLRKYYKAEFDGVCSTEIWVLDGLKNKIINEYLFYIVQSDQFNRYTNVSTGSKMPRADWDFVSQGVFKVPPILEQQKIAEILSTWDKAIELKEQLIKEKQFQKKGLLKKLLTGEMRLPGFEGEWREVRIGELINNKTKKTTVNNQYQVLSCTKDGIVNQSEHFNKQIASENNIGYKILEKGDLVLSPMNLWLGGIDISCFEIGIVSPAYKVYSVDYSIVGENYLRNVLRSEYMIQRYESISQKGASVVRRNLNIADFEDLPILIPVEKSEMDAIDGLIGLAMKEIELLENDFENTKLQKKGLMQLLLTGIVRVNAAEN